MSFREIAGLQFAEMCLRPSHIPKSRPRGSKAAGLRYEKALASAIPRAIHGQWFRYLDLNGPGHCQPDLLIVGQKRVIVLECKLSNVAEGRAQLEGLYLPVVSKVWPEKKALGIVAARHLTRAGDEKLIVPTLKEAILLADAGSALPVLHWMERMPL